VQALDAVRTTQFHIAFFAYNLRNAEMNGLTLARRLKEWLAKPPFIVLMVAEPRPIWDSNWGRQDDLLLKPCTFHEFSALYEKFTKRALPVR
jgi:CheY-like chemotaxis protein